MKQNNRKSTRLTRKHLAIIGVAAIAIIFGLYAWLHSMKTDRQSSEVLPTVSNSSATPLVKTPAPSFSPVVRPAGGAAGQGAAAQSTPSSGAPIESTTQGTSGQSSAIGVNDQNTSYCTFTPGALCTVTFSLEGGNKVVKLDSKSIPSSGTASWLNWTPVSIGITPGAWDVTAVVTVNGKETSSRPEVMYVHS